MLKKINNKDKDSKDKDKGRESKERDKEKGNRTNKDVINTGIEIKMSIKMMDFQLKMKQMMIIG